MPRVATTIPETHESITRPVAYALIRQVCALLSLPTNIKVLLPGASEAVPMTGSTLNYEGDPSQFNSKMRIVAEVTEELIEQQVLSTAVYQQENPPCFVDHALNLRLYPVYSSTQMIIQFTYKAANRVTAKRFRDEAIMRTAEGRAENLHEIDYHYPIPYEYLHLLKHVHELREAQAGYGETFDTWMQDHLTARATNLTTLIGTNPQLSIAEKQIRPMGWFDFSAAPQPETKDNDSGPFNVTFEYRVIFDKVIGMVAHYPLVVHNQLIDESFYGSKRASGNILDPDDRHGVGGYSRYAMDHIARLNNSRCPCPSEISIPEFDEWAPATIHPSTSTLTTVLLAVDPADLRAVVDLKDLGDFAPEPAVLEFLKSEHSYLNNFTHSIVYLSLYRGNVPVENGSLLIDENLIVRSNRDLELRENYHLRIALVTDLTLLSPGAFERFRSAGQACLNILSTLQWTLLRDGYLPKLLGGQYVPRADMIRIGQRINDLRQPHYGTNHVMQTVGNFLIETRRRTDYASDAAQASSTTTDPADFPPSGGTPLSASDTTC